MPKTQDIDDLHATLGMGDIPAKVFVIRWDDITQHESTVLGSEAKLFSFCSSGIILNQTDERLDLQMTWYANIPTPEEAAKAVQSSVLLALPTGTIRNIYQYKLVGEVDLKMVSEPEKKKKVKATKSRIKAKKSR